MFFFTINLLNKVQTFNKTLVEPVDMTIFKTLDIRGLSFFNGYEQTVEAIRGVKINGVLELILDPKKNFTHAFKKWAHDEGHRATDLNKDDQIIGQESNFTIIISSNINKIINSNNGFTIQIPYVPNKSYLNGIRRNIEIFKPSKFRLFLNKSTSTNKIIKKYLNIDKDDIKIENENNFKF